MTNPIIALTGSSGFVGSSLARHLTNQGFKIVCLARTISEQYQHRPYNMEHPLTDNLLLGVDLLIHCAFIKLEENPNAQSINYEGTKNLISAAKKCGVQKIIFFSTVSAHYQAISSYGKGKFQTEQLFDDSDVILQCSLIIGDGGLFKQILNHTLSTRLVPLPNNGNQPMQVIVIDDVLKSVVSIINNKLCGRFILANTERFTYKEFFKVISKVYRKTLFYVPMPISFLKVIAGMAGIAKLKLPFNKENIYSLQTLKELDSFTSIAQLGLQPMSLEEKLKDLKASMS